MGFEGKVALVTGASSGIGQATAKSFVGLGMRTVVTGRRLERLNELGAEAAIAGDMTEEGFVDRLVEKAQELGGPDVALLNAGSMVAGGVDDIDIDAMCAMVRANVESTFRAIYLTAKAMKAKGGGDLFVTSSILGTKVRPTAGAYAGTKHAIEALCEDLRQQLAGTGVRLMSIQPGLVMTELHRNWETHPSKILGVEKPLVPQDVADRIVELMRLPEHVVVPRTLILPADQPI